MEKEELQKEEQKRDVLTGGFMTMLFPAYGGSGYRTLFRLILAAIILYLIWMFFTKTESGKKIIQIFK